MAAVSKMVQLDLFIKDKKELEEKLKKDQSESLKRQVRHLYHQAADQMKRLDLLEELVGALLDDTLSTEKTPLTDSQ